MKSFFRTSGFVVAGLAIGGLGGGIGSAAVLIAHGRVSLNAAAMTTVIVTVVGWGVTTMWSFRNQRQLLVFQIRNEARLSLAETIREEQEWIGDIASLGRSMQTAKALRDLQSQYFQQKDWDFWYKHNTTAREKLYRHGAPGKTLIMVLEEYELLYPETRRFRFQLAHRRSQILEEVGVLVMDLVEDAKRDQAIAALIARSNGDMDYLAILEDLRCHVQNRSLSTLFDGKQIPPRVPLDPTVAITKTGPDGLLFVSQDGTPWPDGQSKD